MKDVLQKALKHAQQVDVMQVHSNSLEVSFENNKLKDVSSEDAQYTSLRVIKDGRLGMSSTSKPGSEEDIVTYALATADFGKQVNYDLPGPTKTPCPDIYDFRLQEMSIDDMVNMGAQLVDALMTYDSKVQVHTSVAKEESMVHLNNSAGFCDSERSTSLSVSLVAELVEGQNMLHCADFQGSTHDELNLSALKDKVIDDLRIARTNVKIKSGAYPVIFTPLGFAMSLSHVIGACINGKAVTKGMSPWKGKIGEQLFDSRITFVNDGTLDRGVGSGKFDAEGVATQRLSLIEKGVLKNYVLDLETAAELGMSPTGTSTGKGPGFNNVLLEGGSFPYGEMLAAMDKGILIDMTMGAWAGNPYGGQVSGNISLGYFVDKGEIVGRVKDAMFSLNLFRALKDQLLGLSSERGNLALSGQSMVLPYVMFDNVNINVKS